MKIAVTKTVKNDHWLIWLTNNRPGKGKHW